MLTLLLVVPRCPREFPSESAALCVSGSCPGECVCLWLFLLATGPFWRSGLRCNGLGKAGRFLAGCIRERLLANSQARPHCPKACQDRIPPAAGRLHMPCAVEARHLMHRRRLDRYVSARSDPIMTAPLLALASAMLAAGFSPSGLQHLCHLDCWPTI